MGTRKRLCPLLHLNPYQINWTIKVQVTAKGPLRPFRNGRGKLFNVELTDKDGTQIQATVFNEAADKFHKELQLSKFYYISNGTVRPANKQYSTVNNDYQLTLDLHSIVEEATDSDVAPSGHTGVPRNFVKIGELQAYIGSRLLVDVIGIVSNVSPTTSVPSKYNSLGIPKRSITILDQSQKIVNISVWNDLATKEVEILSQTIHTAPVVAVTRLRANDFQGISLSTTGDTVIDVNPDIPAAHELRTWYEAVGRNQSYMSAGLFSNRKLLSEITSFTTDETKAVYFNVRAYITFINPHQRLWYEACKSCSKKPIELNSKFWCQKCQRNTDICKRYIFQARIADATAEMVVSIFNDQAEQLLGYSANELCEIKEKETDHQNYLSILMKQAWVPKIFRISVVQTEYNGEKRQRNIVREIGSVDWTAEAKLLLQEIPKIK